MARAATDCDHEEGSANATSQKDAMSLAAVQFQACSVRSPIFICVFHTLDLQVSIDIYWPAKNQDTHAESANSSMLAKENFQPYIADALCTATETDEP